MQKISNTLAEQWFEKGHYHQVNGRNIFVIDSDTSNSESGLSVNPVKNPDKPALCILHGFPTSSFDYWKVLDKLSEHFRVVIHDHIGFGFSDKPLEYSYSLIEQADHAISLWRSMGIKSASFLAHDYGTSILTEMLARDNIGLLPVKIDKIIFCNGSVHIELAKLRLIQRLLRNSIIGSTVAKLSSQNTMKKNLKNIFHDKSLISLKEVEAVWAMMNFNQGKNVLAKVSRYTFERQFFWHRWIGALKQSDQLFEIIWPKNDPIAIPEMAELIKQETKNSQLHWIENSGHFPMLESPQEWLNLVLSSLASKKSISE